MCEICDKSFSTKSELRQHQLLHEKMPVLPVQEGIEEEKKEVVKKYSCSVCDKQYSSYGGLWEHRKKNHQDVKVKSEFPKQCTYCDKMLTTGAAWHKHIQTHERLSQHTQPTVTKVPAFMNGIRSTAPPNLTKVKTAREEDAESYFTCNK